MCSNVACCVVLLCLNVWRLLADWAECMREIVPHTRHIHARVGYAQGPQVGQDEGGCESSSPSSSLRFSSRTEHAVD